MTASEYLKNFLIREINKGQCVYVCNDMCQHLQNQHNSVKQYFPKVYMGTRSILTTRQSNRF